MKKLLLSTLAFGLASSAFAAPAFDRPGAAFSTEVLPVGGVIWEQGLPDIEHNDDHGLSETTYTFDSRLRVGITQGVEMQIFGNPYIKEKTSVKHGASDTTDGAGNTGIAFKLLAPSYSDSLTIAVLASVEFNTGKSDFANFDGADKKRTYNLGITSEWTLTNSQSVGAFVDFTKIGDRTIYNISPSWSMDINPEWGVYIEYVGTFGDIPERNHLLGGGVTWLIADRVQLDTYVNFGLTKESSDYETGFGISYWIN